MASPVKTMPKTETAVEEIVIPKDLQEFLGDIVEGRHGFRLGDPWKYSDTALAVVVPIIREQAPERPYTTMYEVLKQMGIKDSGHVSGVEIQNKTGKAVFVRAGTIFTGATQNRAAENSTVVQPGKTEIPVRCVHQTHGIQTGSEMKYGDIAPMNVTMNLIARAGQGAVWNSVRQYTGGDREYHCTVQSASGKSYGNDLLSNDPIRYSFDGNHHLNRLQSRRGMSGINDSYSSGGGNSYSGNSGNESGHYFVGSVFSEGSGSGPSIGTGSDDLLGYMNKVNGGRDVINDMLQKVPLTPEQVGAIVFNPVGVVAVETFDHPLSWEAIKKEVIEKFGDKVTKEQAEHLFELKPDKILPAIKKFIEGLKKNHEHTVRKDDKSETRVVIGEGLVGEYTLVKNRVIHAIIVREN